MRKDQEPLLDAEEFVGRVDDELLEEFEGEMIDPDDVDPDDVYAGRSIKWVGLSGRMYRASWDQVQAFPGNNFDNDKLATFVALYEDNSGILVHAPPAGVSFVDLRDVQESLVSASNEELFASLGMTRPFTTGDEELDDYLLDPVAFLAINAANEDDERELKAEIDARLAEAVEKRRGDLGKFVFQLRDGNHRAFAAQLAGERSIWLEVRKSLQGDLPSEDLE